MRLSGKNLFVSFTVYTNLMKDCIFIIIIPKLKEFMERYENLEEPRLFTLEEFSPPIVGSIDSQSQLNPDVIV